MRFPLFSLASKKGTKRNACEDTSNVKKQAKVDLYHFVTTKLQTLYAWLWKERNLYRSSKLYFVFYRKVIDLTTSPKADDPPQSTIARSVCPKKGFTLFLFMLCSILVLESSLTI